MGLDALSTLAIAACLVFGAGGVLLGILIGVRTIARDEERFGSVSLALETTRADMSRLKVEWTTTLEQLEQLLATVEKKRRQAAASLSAQERKEADQVEAQPVLSPQEMRNEIRRRMRMSAGGRS